jgi:phosphatidylglycerol:prolipoprotein diacylglycerol transferase
VLFRSQYRYYIATFFIESILNLVGFAVLFVYFFYEIKLKDRRVTFTKRDRSKYYWGSTSALYLIWYGVVRVIVEPLRTDSLYIFGHNPIVFNRISFMLSIALIGLGVLLFIAARRKWTSQTTPTPPKKTNT